MDNYRRGNYRKDYEENQEVVKARQNQPVTSLPGNYRVDSEGQPILPNRSNLTNYEELEQDYFSRDQEDVPVENVKTVDPSYQPKQTINPIQPAGQAKPEQRVYQFDDYYRRENELNGRMRQPNRRNYVPPQRSHYSNNRDNQQNNRGRSYSADHRQPRIPNQSQPTSWYFRFHQWMNRRSQTQSTASLPKGKTALFAVFTLIYLTMLVTAWQLMPFNKVNNIVVSGNELVPASFIEASSRILSYDEVDEVMSQRQEIEKKIKDENPLVESIVFTRPDWQHLEISVVEHELVGIINNNGYHPVLTNGVIIDASSNQELASIAYESLPELVGFETSGELANIAQGLRQIDSEILTMMSTITKSTDPNKANAIEVEMKDGNVIKAIISTFAQKVQYYPDILSQLEGSKGIINFEVGAYFTPDVANANSIKLDNN